MRPETLGHTPGVSEGAIMASPSLGVIFKG